MPDVDDITAPVDGRVARRERNVNAVLDVVLEMFAEESLLPTIEEASKRSGLSLRSLYRYFADPGELLEAVIVRNREAASDAGHLSAIGEGSLDSRIEDFVAMRIRLYDAIGPVYRATIANAARHPRVREELARTRNDFRRQFELQFAPELRRRKGREHTAVLAAGDVLTQMDSIDYLRRQLQMTVAETEYSLVAAIGAVLGPDSATR
jgi:AcrR family transcriptional regulator